MVMVSVRILHNCMLTTIACLLIDFPNDIKTDEIKSESAKDCKTDVVNITVCG